jgi:hypothetical protein
MSLCPPQIPQDLTWARTRVPGFASGYYGKINLLLRYEGVWQSRCTDPRILDESTGWMWVLSFKPRQL